MGCTPTKDAPAAGQKPTAKKEGHSSKLRQEYKFEEKTSFGIRVSYRDTVDDNAETYAVSKRSTGEPGVARIIKKSSLNMEALPSSAVADLERFKALVYHPAQTDRNLCMLNR